MHYYMGLVNLFRVEACCWVDFDVNSRLSCATGHVRELRQALTLVCVLPYLIDLATDRLDT